MAVDSPKRMHDDVEEIKTNLAAATVFTRDAGDGRKRSPKDRRKSSPVELRH